MLFAGPGLISTKYILAWVDGLWKSRRRLEAPETDFGF
jgi:hypothetical protein